jgi:ComF family protein
MASSTTARSIMDRMLATLFPSRCLGCGLRGVVLCEGCTESVPWLGSEVCPICAATSRLARICPSCRSAPPMLDGSRAACKFDGVTRRAIHDLKYRGIRARAELLGDLVAEALERRPLAIDLLVPVPLAAGRRRQRGFNQAELIADRLGEQLQVPVHPQILKRLRETPPQVRRSAEERRLNVADAFGCGDPDAVRGRRVGVVDDVMTTGATLNACAEALKAVGVTRAYGIVVAREV